jgi:zinc transport system permease protein
MNAIGEMWQQDFMRHVLIGTTLIAGLCGYLGVFIVLRRAVFVGAALAQISSLGVALSYFVCGVIGGWLSRDLHVPPQPPALALTLAASALFALQQRERRLPRETWIGIAYAAASALAILVVAQSAHVHAEVLNLLFGNVLTISPLEVAGLLGLVALIGGLHGTYRKEFLFTTFDPDMATAVGIPARRWTLVLFLSVGLTVSLAIHAAGALVVFNFLVLPAAAGLLAGRSLRGVFLIAVVSAVGAAGTGVTVSYVADWPTGPTIVMASAGILTVAGVTGSLRRVR